MEDENSVETKNKVSKVLVIGIDAMDPRITNKLMERGKLPNFKKLESYASLETTIPPETPVAWSAASTGSNPGRYGIFDFIGRDTETYIPRLSIATEKHGKTKTEYVSSMRGIPFWRILSDNNVPVTVIRWPVTFPAEKINGKMLSGLGVVDVKGMLNSYSFYTNEEFAEDMEGKEKIIPVNAENSMIETYISGPLRMKGGQLIDVRIPMKIEVAEEGAVIEISEKKHAIKNSQWSDMIKVKFKTGILTEVHGILKFYLMSTAPKFRMYATSVQLDPEKQSVKITHPEEYGKELAERVGLFYTLGMPEDTKAVTENVLDESAFLEQIRQIEEERKRMFYHEFERFREGAFVFAFDSGDRLKHIFWKPGTFNSESGFSIPKEIEDYYLEKDRFIGDVLSKLDERTKLIIFSDHGFSDFTRQVNINSWLVEEGYMKAAGTGKALFQSVDWGSTRAYSLGFTSLYVNLKGRESKGAVSVEEKEELINEIVNKLKGLEDKEMGKRVFTNVYCGSEIYTGAYAHLAPDIILGFSPGYRMSWKSAIGALDTETIFDNKSKWRGDHLIDRSHVPGVLFANFKINKQNPNIMDIAPTVLKFFNIKPQQDMDGESLV